MIQDGQTIFNQNIKKFNFFTMRRQTSIGEPNFRQGNQNCVGATLTTESENITYIWDDYCTVTYQYVCEVSYT